MADLTPPHTVDDTHTLSVCLLLRYRCCCQSWDFDELDPSTVADVKRLKTYNDTK